MGEPFSPEGRGRPQTDQLGFDRRLMSPERLLQLAGPALMRCSESGIPNVSLDCALCGKAIEFLTDRHGGRYKISAQQLLQNTLRHLVMRHELSLAGGGETGGGQ